MVRAHHLDRPLPRGELARAAATIGIRDVQGSALLALAARVEVVDDGQVADAFARRTLVAVAGPRGNPTLVPAADAAVFSVGALPAGEESLRVFLKPALEALDRSGLTTEQALARACDVARDALAGGPLDPGALATAMTRALPELSAPCRGRCGAVHVDVGLFDLVGVAGVWCLVRAEDGGWLHVRTDQWLPATAPPTGNEESRQRARRELVRRYVRAYGRPSPADLAAWAHLSRADARASVDELSATDVTPDAADVAPDEDAPVEVRRDGGVRLLPPHDPYLEGRNRSSLVPDPAARQRLWRAQASPGAVLLDGEIVATWRARRERSQLAVRVAAIGARLTKDTVARIAAEAERIAPLRHCTTASVAVE